MSDVAKIIQMKIHTWNFIFPLLSFYLIQVSINTPVLLLGGGVGNYFLVQALHG